MKRRVAMFMTAGGIVLLDQLTKFIVNQTRPYLSVIPGFFNLSYVENRGAAFGILQGKQYFLTTVSIVAMLVLLYLLFSEHEQKKGILWSFALILGGTCGNLIDRIRLGYVIDFLDFYIKRSHWPAFNIADSAISIGVGLLILFTLLEESSSRQRSS